MTRNHEPTIAHVHTKYTYTLNSLKYTHRDLCIRGIQSTTHSTGSGVTVTGTIHTITGVVIVPEVTTRMKKKNTACDVIIPQDLVTL